MPSLTAIPGLPPDAVEQLAACGIESAEMLAAIPAVEIHRVLELTAWQRGKLNRAPTLDTVYHWAGLARATAGPEAVDDIPEAIVIPRTTVPPARLGGYVPPAQRARLQAAGPPTPAAPLAVFPLQVEPAVPVAVAQALPVVPAVQPNVSAEVVVTPVQTAVAGFHTFEDYQAGKARVMPLSRYSIDAPIEDREAMPTERGLNTDDFPRTMRRGVVYPNPVLLVCAAIISLVWRLALLAAILAVPWLVLMVPQPSVYKLEILSALGILTALGLAQLIVMGRVRCRICTCHLFHSRNTAKNRKAHCLPFIGYTASLSLHVLLFQWFRCMYCGTAIKLWSTRAERAERMGMG